MSFHATFNMSLNNNEYAVNISVAMQCGLFKKTAMFIFHSHSNRMKIMQKRIGERMLNMRNGKCYFTRFTWYFIINIKRINEGENIIENVKYKINTVTSQ